MIIKMNNLIIKVRLSKEQTTNEYLLEEDEKILKSSFNSKNNEKSDNEEVITFDKKEDYELVRTLENILLTSSSSEVDVEITFHIQLSVRTNDQYQADKRDSERVFLVTLQKDFLRIFLDQNDKQISYKICFQKEKDQDEKFEDFDIKKIISIFYKTLVTE